MQLTITLLIVALAAAIVLRAAWNVLRGGKPGCGSACASCPSNASNKTSGPPLVSLDLNRKS